MFAHRDVTRNLFEGEIVVPQSAKHLKQAGKNIYLNLLIAYGHLYIKLIQISISVMGGALALLLEHWVSAEKVNRVRAVAGVSEIYS